jgi:ABC-type dipeptide/oligopeptide/nickel transport system permease component
MLAYVLRRLLWSIPVLFAVSIITFVLMHLVPGDPWNGCGHRVCPAGVKDQFDQYYGLDKPLFIQYVTYMSHAIRGDFGPTFGGSGRSVNRIIGEGLPVSAAFGLSALVAAIIVGIPLGIILALRRNTRLDYIATLLVAASISVPNLVIAIGLILVFVVKLRVLLQIFDQNDWRTWVLPFVLLWIKLLGVVMRFTRAAALETLGQEYIRTAHMKGLPDSTIVFRHILRNALLPIVTLLGPLAADLLTGVLIVERTFSIPGLSESFIASITSGDYPLLMGVTLLFAAILIAFNLLVDLSYAVIDPRIALS